MRPRPRREVDHEREGSRGGLGRSVGWVTAPPAGLPKDGNGAGQRVLIGTLVVEEGYELPVSQGKASARAFST